MSVINTQPLIGASGQATGYNLERSLRFRSSASAYLNRTPASAGNRQKWTWSGWVKRGTLGGLQQLFSATAASPSTNSDLFGLAFDTNDCLIIGGGASTFLITTQVFRDPSAWYHIVVAFDTTQATTANRIKVYVNGTQVTSFSTSNYVTQNLNTGVNSTIQHDIGSLMPFLTRYFDGYMTDVNFVDGQQLDASSFGETDTITGVWKPKRYAGTYGTNGFYLPFTNIASTSTLGNDFSGNGNNWTVNNVSLTSGATYDSMTDVPTLTDASTANYCVLNPLNKGSASSLNNANLNFSVTSASGSIFQSQITGTIGASSGKFYWEVTPTSGSAVVIGIARTTRSMTSSPFVSGAGNIYVYIGSTGQKNEGSTSSAYGATFTNNDVIGVAFDATAGTITFYKNNTSQGQAFSGISGEYMPYLISDASATSTTGNFNFGQRPFAYTPPSGFVALNTFNLPDSTIKAGNKYMDATTYTATGTTQAVTNSGTFKPDLVWTKNRSGISAHYLMDSVRGPSLTLQSQLTNAEASLPNYLTSFNSNGFTIGTDNYANGTSVVGWQWQAGQGSTSSNTSGSITSTTSVNASAGFSVVTFTVPGSGTSATIGHGLGVAPSFIITKSRTQAYGWATYHVSLGNTQRVLLNTTDASGTTTAWNNTTPTSTVFTVGSSIFGNDQMVAYCWSEIEGFSKFGSYTGNGSTDGVFVYTGFRPKFILVKRSSSSGTNWNIYDTSRIPSNVADDLLFADLSNAELANESTLALDILSNGFKVRTSGSSINQSSGTFVYAAFAESPFKNSLAR